MNEKNIPRLLIGASQSGVGKTSTTLAIVAALSNRGLKVQTFKVGPDYLDPTYLAILSGRPCYNLDGWMMGREYVERLFLEKSSDADIAIIEGVMGLFDGAQPENFRGSSAEIAIWLEAPTILVVNAHGMAGSIAALVLGFSMLDPGLCIAGVIANQTGSSNHRSWLEKSCASNNLAPIVGAFPRGAFKTLPNRRLGLVTASNEILGRSEKLDLANAAENHLDVHKIVDMAHSAKPYSINGPPTFSRSSAHMKIRLGLAYDKAFHFYYQDNIDALENWGIQIVRFSPVEDKSLPEDIDFVYVGGGYPEEFAQELSKNESMRSSMREYAASNRPLYAECGGLMYFSRGIELDDSSRHEMVGLLPAWTRMRKNLRALRYCEVHFNNDTIITNKGSLIRGHEFHYSELVEFDGSQKWRKVYSVSRPSQDVTFEEGFQRGNILLSYIHLHFASHADALERIILVCSNIKAGRSEFQESRIVK